MIRLDLDERAREWLEANGAEAWVIDYDVHRCCGGGKICEVTVRADDGKRSRDDYVQALGPDGTRFSIDPRAARRLPPRVTLTLKRGARKHLDLELTGEEWGDLLYT